MGRVDPQRPPVILMPGVDGRRRQWRRPVARLRELGIDARVIHAPAFGIATIEQDVERFLEAIEQVRSETGSDRVRLAGHSKAGIAAIIAASRTTASVDIVVTVASPHSGVGPPNAVELVDRLPAAPPFLRDLAHGSAALGLPEDRNIEIVAIHHEHWDGLVSARAAHIEGEGISTIAYGGGGWRGVHALGVGYHPDVVEVIVEVLSRPVRPSRPADDPRR
jgi:pimeloyl-ACP methyl ester carboxylesterase